MNNFVSNIAARYEYCSCHKSVFTALFPGTAYRLILLSLNKFSFWKLSKDLPGSGPENLFFSPSATKIGSIFVLGK